MELEVRIKAEAKRLGFDLVGIAKPAYSPVDHDRLLNWLADGYQAEMSYMARSPRRRSDPRLFLEDVKSIIIVGISYYQEPNYESDRPYISIYARGKPYQDVIREKLTSLLDFIKSPVPDVRGKIAVDTSPTFDKLWAQKAGLGWRGKNTLLLNRKLGSFIFLGELFINIDLEPDKAESDHCADCYACVDACPTGALTAPYRLNAEKCISYLTIEANSELENPYITGNHIYGCDLCQLVCPYNKSLPATRAEEFGRHIDSPSTEGEWLGLTEADFKNRYSGTILDDFGFIRFEKNVKLALLNIEQDKMDYKIPENT